MMRFVFFRNIPLITRRLWSRLTRRYSVRSVFLAFFLQPLRFFFEVFLKRFVKDFLIDTFLIQGTARLMLTISKGLSLMNTGALRVSLLWIVVGLFFIVVMLTL